MKYSFLLLAVPFIISLVSCQKKPYTSFQKSYQPQYANPSNNLVVHNTQIIGNLKAQEAPTSLSFPPIETFSADHSASVAIGVMENTSVVAHSSSQKKLNLDKKVQIVKQIKNFSKRLTKNTVRKLDSKTADNVATYAFLLGALGIVILFFSSIVGLAFGVAGVILGAISLQKTNKRKLAILAIILGSLATLIGLLIIFYPIYMDHRRIGK